MSAVDAAQAGLVASSSIASVNDILVGAVPAVTDALVPIAPKPLNARKSSNHRLIGVVDPFRFVLMPMEITAASSEKSP